MALVLLTAGVFAPVLHFDFVNYDDLEFVVENPHVATGLSAANIRWAVANAYTATGGPVTWISHMADAEFFGLDAGAHHLTSLLLHTLNTILLFGVLSAMTAAWGRSAFVSALFAVHPLHVESVAWIAERKDVLSTSFWLLATWAYVFYARRPSLSRYVAVAALFAIGLLSKPMVATLPFVLLLLDLWPLERLRDASDATAKIAVGRRVRDLVVEKIPLGLLSAVAIWLTYIAQRASGAVAPREALPLAIRLSNAAVSCVVYIRQMLWPVGLAAFYPYRLGIAPAVAAGCAVFVIGATALAVIVRRSAPYVTVGWLWYVGTLVPVIGLVQLGSHAMADRFTYVPLIGLFILVAWGGVALAERFGVPLTVLAAAAVVTVVGCAVVARAQSLHWQNGVALWSHTARVTQDNARAHANLGVALTRTGQRAAAISEYTEALRIDPGYAEAHNNLALALVDAQRADEALPHFLEAIRLKPDYANAHVNVANLLDDRGDANDAIAHYREAIRLEPSHVLARINMGVALARSGKIDDAVAELDAVLRIDPANQAARSLLDEMKRAGNRGR